MIVDRHIGIAVIAHDTAWVAIWLTPGILEALIPGRIQGHGGTAEVSGRAA